MKQQTSMRLADETLALRATLARKLGITETGVVELAIRRLAEIEHVKVEPARPTPQRKRTPAK